MPLPRLLPVWFPLSPGSACGVPAPCAGAQHFGTLETTPTRGPLAHTEASASLFLLDAFLNDARTGMVKSPAVDECTDFNASRMFALYRPMDLSPTFTAVH